MRTHAKLTHEQQARIDAYMDEHYPRVYPPPRKTRKARPQPTMTNTELMDENGCSDRLDCECAQCENVRELIKPQGSGNANPFKRAA